MRFVATLLLGAALLGACTSADAGGIDVDDVQEADAPARDAHLVEASWPETAAWIDRETDASHPVIVNFFASWCEPCRAEAPLIGEAAEQHPDITFLGVNYRDQEKDGAAFLTDTGLDIPTVRDFDGTVGEALGLRGMPTTFVFDAEGELVDTHLGEMSREELDALLAQVSD